MNDVDGVDPLVYITACNILKSSSWNLDCGILMSNVGCLTWGVGINSVFCIWKFDLNVML